MTTAATATKATVLEVPGLGWYWVCDNVPSGCDPMGIRIGPGSVEFTFDLFSSHDWREFRPVHMCGGRFESKQEAELDAYWHDQSHEDPPKLTPVKQLEASCTSHLGISADERISNPRWDRARSSNDWRNHVPDEVKAVWPKLDRLGRLAVLRVALEAAVNE